MNIFNLIGRYMLLMGKVFSRPERRSVYKRRVLAEMETLGLNSIGIVTLVSVFMGAVLMLQMCINFESPFIPRELMGYATRETMILEFSSTVVALILAGRVGSSIASEIGTMRITEQIDALEIMGVNSASYLILPENHRNGHLLPAARHPQHRRRSHRGIRHHAGHGNHHPGHVHHRHQNGFQTLLHRLCADKDDCICIRHHLHLRLLRLLRQGNSLEVGRASTKAVVVSSVVILMMDLIITQISYL